MSKHQTAAAACVSPPEFLAALGRSGVLPDAKWQEVQERFGRGKNLAGSMAMAQVLVEEGTLNEFQARRLLKGKKVLAFGRYTLLDRIGQGGRGRVFKARHCLMDRTAWSRVGHVP